MAAPILNVKVANVSQSKGRGLIASTHFQEGDVILVEKPVVCAQFSWNELYKYQACEFCLKSIETAEAMARRLSNDHSLALSHPECCDVNLSDISPCPHCQVLYCSAECRDSAASLYHQSLCLGPSKDDSNHPMNALMEEWRSFHYPPESTSAMLIAKMIGILKQTKDKEAVISTFSDFYNTPVNEEDGFAHKLLGKQFEAQRDFLRCRLSTLLNEESAQQWFHPEGFNRLIAMIGTNGQGIGSSSFSRWVKNVENLPLTDAERSEVDSEIERVYEKMDEVSGVFLDCEGSGLYTLQSKCNHSCVPNAEITFPCGDNTLSLVALKDITPEEEITISYLGCCDNDRSRHSRQKILRENYLFQCVCEKCLSQADDDSETSEDDDDEEEDMNDET